MTQAWAPPSLPSTWTSGSRRTPDAGQTYHCCALLGCCLVEASSCQAVRPFLRQVPHILPWALCSSTPTQLAGRAGQLSAAPHQFLLTAPAVAAFAAAVPSAAPLLPAAVAVAAAAALQGVGVFVQACVELQLQQDVGPMLP